VRESRREKKGRASDRKAATTPKVPACVYLWLGTGKISRQDAKVRNMNVRTI
jgi:hypothetical protein